MRCWWRISSARIPRVHALGAFPPGSAGQRVYEAQCTGGGSTFSITLEGGQDEAFVVLNALRIFVPR
jgi:methionine-gamma-lyase